MSLQKLLEDQRVWVVAGVVKPPQFGGSHHDVVASQIMVHVVSKTRHTPMWAHMSDGFRDGSGRWKIPSIGTEVLVGFGDGDAEGDPFIISTYGRRSGPTSLGESVTDIVDAVIQARSQSGTAHPVATKQDLQNLKTAIQNASIGVSDGGALFKSSLLAALVNWPVGTAVFKAE